MSLEATINEDIKTAMKAGDKIRLDRISALARGCCTGHAEAFTPSRKKSWVERSFFLRLEFVLTSRTRMY